MKLFLFLLLALFSLKSVQARPDIIVSVESLRDEAFPQLKILPDNTIFLSGQLRLKTAGFNPDDVVRYDIGTDIVVRYQNSSITEILFNQGVRAPYLAVYDPFTNSFHLANPEELESNALTYVSGFTVINSRPYLLKQTELFEVDTDGDGVNNQIETDLAINILEADTDGDGVNDFDELNFDGIALEYSPSSDTDPNDPDSDGDGIIDGEDSEPLISNNPTPVPMIPSPLLIMFVLGLILFSLRTKFTQTYYFSH